MLNQVTKIQVKKLTLDSEIVTHVIPSTVELTSTINDNDRIRIADIAINGDVTTIYAPPHQNISHKLDSVEFSNISGDFLKTDVAEGIYAKKEEIPGIATESNTGTIKLGYKSSNQNDKKYPVQINDQFEAYVEVPWAGGNAKDIAVDNDTIKKYDDSTNSIYVNQIPTSKITNLTSFEDDEKNKQYGIKLTDSGYPYVEVPWESGNTIELENSVDNSTIIVNDNNKLQVNTILSSNITDLNQTVNDLIDIRQIDISKVVFKEEFKFVGNYTFGLIKPSITEEYTVEPNTSLLDVLKIAFCGTKVDAQPVITNPSMTLNVTGISNNSKVGETVTPKYDIIFYPGEYKTTLNGDTKLQDTGVRVESCEVNLYVGNDPNPKQTLTSKSGTFDSITINNTDKIKIKATVTYSNGDFAKTYNEIITTKRIEAGNRTTTKEYTPINEIVKCYAGTFNSLDEIIGLTDDDLKQSEILSQYNDIPKTLPFAIKYDDEKNGIVFYVLKNENIDKIKVGNVYLSKQSTYSTTNYDCYYFNDADGEFIAISKDSVITITYA